MKYTYLTFVFIVAFSTIIYGESINLISSKHVFGAEAKVNAILAKSEAFVSVNFVEIHLDSIRLYENFAVKFGEKTFSMTKERLVERGNDNFYFAGNDGKGNRIILTVLGRGVHGVIETVNGVFSVETTKENEYVVIKVDQSRLKEGCENLPEKGNSPSTNVPLKISPDIELPNATRPYTYPCENKVRVLVLYTNKALNYVQGDIKRIVWSAVDLTNESFINSAINYQIELAYLGQTNYQETVSYATDLSRFRNLGDKYMDEVHSLRDKYAADICVLLIENDKICGRASGIGVAAADAFCVVSVNGNCATTYYSFGHEIGHLLGCRHDPYTDNSSTPFAYGHGYVSPTKMWRTIMAYKEGCNGCTRLQYWSNPNITYGGAPMGTVPTHNNARVWNEKSSSVMTFKQPGNNVALTNNDIPNTQYADIMAKQNITTNGTMAINSGNTLQMRAGNSITINSGFSVGQGVKFSARIEDVQGCP